MQLRRARHLFSARRLDACRSLFRSPFQAHLGLAFLTHKPVQLTLRNGQSLVFSRSGRDHLFWDWFLRHPRTPIAFTAEREISLHHHGLDLLLRPGTTDFFIFREIFLRDEYELMKLPEKLGTVIDLGGNVGLFTCALLPRAQRVITVEPVAANFLQAARNITRNGGAMANLLRYAVTGHSGDEITIHLSARNTGMNSVFAGWVEKGGSDGQETVPTISLPDLLSRVEGDIDLLKCDIEGAEFDVFQATPAPMLRRLCRLVMEVHLGPEHPATSMHALTAQLGAAGIDVECHKIGSRGANETWLLRGNRQVQRTFACRG